MRRYKRKNKLRETEREDEGYINSTCFLCGQDFGNSKFIIIFKKRFLHVCCEQELLDEPYYSNGIFYDYGIRK